MTNSENRVYYVALTGSDSNNGQSLESPFKTIGRAAEIMQAGDSCYIREGTYRETVKPAASGTQSAPIRFEAFQGEQVVVSGCDLITQWTLHEGSIYKGAMDWNVEDGNGNMIFVNGEICGEAQWPNVSDRLARTQYAVVDRAENDNRTGAIFDEDLKAFPDGYWDGAMVACVNGVGYFISTAPVNRFASGTLYYDQWVSSAPYYHAGAGDIYFITRSLRALDTEKEWYYDSSEQKLYLWAPGGDHPEHHVVEAKRREYAFDLRDRAYIEVVGIGCRAASITTQEAHHCQIIRSALCGLDRYFGPRQSIYGRTKGIELGGRNNVLRDCEISHFEGIGIHISGARNQIVNCYIHDGNFESSYASLVWMTGSDHLISHCTITRSGRTCVSGVFAHSVIQYCDISFANCLTKDSGIIYLFNHDFDNTEIHHNWLHDNVSNHLSFGFYMDAWTSGVNFFNNVVWNIPHHGLHMNRPIQRALIYNNTFHRSANTRSSVFALDDMMGVHLANNIFADGEIIDWSEESLVTNNVIGQEVRFVDEERGDYRLQANSPAVGAGLRINGVTDDHPGAAPDAGAYPYNGEYWAPGYNFSQSVQANLQFTALSAKSQIGNVGFETGEWHPWTVLSGNPSIVFECAWDYSNFGYKSVTRSNKYAAMLGKGDAIEQVATGLQPNTTYSFWAGIRTGGYYRSADKYDECQASHSFHKAPNGGLPIYRDVTYVGPLRDGDWLRYNGIDFGKKGKYDVFDAGMTKIVGPILLEVRLDRADGELIGTVSVVSEYDNVWRYFSTPIRGAAGVHDVFLVLKGAGQCLLQSFKLYHSQHASPVRISVQGHDGDSKTRTVRRLNWDARMEHLEFTTGPNGDSATVSIENAGEHYIYVDDCGLWNPKL
ncbi:right-handed parallel beta-helix repeat-containing protein [Paenibacillus hodogayensis]|uniref:Right-handed parallel beta-helix repeat-containing protein n=1 Tax=Paenibacillus hodogayensis TaxID=279208 RepID=A0ABV5W943_9BACL